MCLPEGLENTSLNKNVPSEIIPSNCKGLKLGLKSKLSNAFSLFLFPKENHRVTGFH